MKKTLYEYKDKIKKLPIKGSCHLISISQKNIIKKACSKLVIISFMKYKELSFFGNWLA